MGEVILPINYIISYQIATIIKALRLSQSYRHPNQWTRTENTKIEPDKYAQMIFDRDAEGIKWRNDKDNLFNK